MTAPLRWRGWLILVAALVLFSACSSATVSHPITGVTATTGPVTVTTNLSHYTIGDAIGVTVTNNSKSQYYTQDGKSACSIAQLERYDATTGAWKPMDSCNGGKATQTLLIAESASVPYTLAPSSSSDVNAWQSGTYRVSVTYSTQPDGITNPQEAHSAAFTVS
ncbi:MAG TPA: hypothetical protein VE338_19000 [Ktedonobacterales bacterium]|jgi:hypothetical protein|nr:hypothetical protein [Ktedonobacterales bacterium]